nr:hypothetical protein CFP56_16847 [Quercus suber]
MVRCKYEKSEQQKRTNSDANMGSHSGNRSGSTEQGRGREAVNHQSCFPPPLGSCLWACRHSAGVDNNRVNNRFLQMWKLEYEDKQCVAVTSDVLSNLMSMKADRLQRLAVECAAVAACCYRIVFIRSSRSDDPRTHASTTVGMTLVPDAQGNPDVLAIGADTVGELDRCRNMGYADAN